MRLILPSAICLVFAQATCASAGYDIMDLGSLFRHSLPGAVNDSGEAAFYVLPKGSLDSPLLLPGVGYVASPFANPQSWTILPNVGPYVYIYDINNSGAVIGGSGLRSYLFRDGWQSEITSHSHEFLDAKSINNDGQIVGSASTDDGERGFIWNNTEDVVFLGTLGGRNSVAFGVNNHSIVVGASDTGIQDGASPIWEAFVCQNGSMQGLGTLGGYASTAFAINDSGVVVGEAQTADREVHAFVYDPVHGMQDLGIPGVESVALDINNAGWIVGAAGDLGGNTRAFVYSPAGDRWFLDELIPSNSPWQRLISAKSINSGGQILGQGLINNELHVFLATPSPEPSAVFLLGMALPKFYQLTRLRQKRQRVAQLAYSTTRVVQRQEVPALTHEMKLQASE